LGCRWYVIQKNNNKQARKYKKKQEKKKKKRERKLTVEYIGQDQIRGLWRHYFLNTQAVIFVVDSNDGHRLKEARDELWKVLESPELNNAVILVFANKQDLPHALTAAEVANGLEIEKITTHPTHVQPACATTGDGLDEGFDWMASLLGQKKGGGAASSN
jgi:signal recognition particle receptor subunit beta